MHYKLSHMFLVQRNISVANFESKCTITITRKILINSVGMQFPFSGWLALSILNPEEMFSCYRIDLHPSGSSTYDQNHTWQG